jgi:hypothetical protein
MHEPTSTSASAQPVSGKSTLGQSNGGSERDFTNVGQKTTQPLEDNSKQIMLAVTRLTSSSIEDLQGLSAELQKLQEFLQSECERVQHEIDSAVAGAKIIIETIAPWRRSPATNPQVSPNGSSSQHTRQT